MSLVVGVRHVWQNAGQKYLQKGAADQGSQDDTFYLDTAYCKYLLGVPNKKASGRTWCSVIGTTNRPSVIHLPNQRNLNYMTFEVLDSSKLQLKRPTPACLRRASSLFPFEPVALPYHDEWQASRSAQVTLLTARILFWLLPELEKKKKKWVGSVCRVAQPCFRAFPINTQHRKARNMQR